MSASLEPQAADLPSGVAESERFAGVASGVVPDVEPEIAVVKRKRDPIFWFSVVWIGLMVVAAFIGPAVLTDPQKELNEPLLGLSFSHLLGTDTIGHDLFVEAVYGARISMLVAFFSVLTGLVIGGAIGLVAGYAKGVVSAVLMWFVDVLLAMPALVFALFVVTFRGSSLGNVVGVISILSIPGYARVARALTLTYANENFVMAARGIGATHWRIMLREVLPNVIVPLASFAALGAAIAIIAEGALAFLGLSVAGSISWGSLISAGQQMLSDSPLPALAPMIFMFLTILSFNFIGERLGAVLDPREGQL